MSQGSLKASPLPLGTRATIKINISQSPLQSPFGSQDPFNTTTFHSQHDLDDPARTPEQYPTPASPQHIPPPDTPESSDNQVRITGLIKYGVVGSCSDSDSDFSDVAVGKKAQPRKKTKKKKDYPDPSSQELSESDEIAAAISSDGSIVLLKKPNVLPLRRRSPCHDNSTPELSLSPPPESARPFSQLSSPNQSSPHTSPRHSPFDPIPTFSQGFGQQDALMTYNPSQDNLSQNERNSSVASDLSLSGSISPTLGATMPKTRWGTRVRGRGRGRPPKEPRKKPAKEAEKKNWVRVRGRGRGGRPVFTLRGMTGRNRNALKNDKPFYNDLEVGGVILWIFAEIMKWIWYNMRWFGSQAVDSCPTHSDLTHQVPPDSPKQRAKRQRNKVRCVYLPGYEAIVTLQEPVPQVVDELVLEVAGNLEAGTMPDYAGLNDKDLKFQLQRCATEWKIS